MPCDHLKRGKVIIVSTRDTFFVTYKTTVIEEAYLVDLTQVDSQVVGVDSRGMPLDTVSYFFSQQY